MPRKRPPLTPTEVIAILTARGFVHKNTKGSHANYEGHFDGKTRKVTVDLGVPEFWDDLMKSMIRQSGMDRDEFYCSTKSTAKKINMKEADFEIEQPPQPNNG